jgi:hypothetical protein
MTTPEQLALIHGEIDGELDAAGRAELARWMLADPDGRALRDELRRLCTALDSVVAVEPPDGLRDRILAALQHSYVPPQRSWAPGWRYAALIVGIVVAGAVVLETVRGPSPAPAEVAGTMSAPAATLIAMTRLADGAVLGDVSLYREPSGLGLRFDLAAGTPVDVLVTGGGHTLRVNGVGTADKGSSRMVALPGFPADMQKVDLVFIRGGRQVGSATLRPSGER